jgi:hypothetical protein
MPKRPDHKMRASISSLVFLALLAMTGTSCHTVKPYQRAYLNDEAMQMGKRSIENLSSNVHNYREGASGGGRAKGGGGCGCN